MNLFVGNLIRDIRKEELHELFKQYGRLDSITILIDRIQGEWQAFGFVDMPNPEEAKKAIQNLNKYNFHDKNLIVHEARIRTIDRRSNGRGGGRRFSDSSE